MKKIILISTIIAVIALAGGFAGGWYVNNKVKKSNLDKVATTGNNFMYKLFSYKNDEAYAMMDEGYKSAINQEDFNKKVAVLNDQSLEPGITTTYNNGAKYMMVQEYIDKDGKPTKVAVLDISKIGKKIVINSVSTN